VHPPGGGEQDVGQAHGLSHPRQRGQEAVVGAGLGSQGGRDEPADSSHRQALSLAIGHGA